MDYRPYFYPEFSFGGFTDIDATVIFFMRVNSLLNPRDIVLDIGCGRGGYGKTAVTFKRDLIILKNKCTKVIGIDVDPSAQANPFIDEFRLIQGDRWPLADASIDLCVCNAVLEHVKDIDIFFKESRRVLKTGGILCISTANVLGYNGILSKIIPNKLHRKILNIAQPNRKEIDIYPTHYKCNTITRMRYMLNKYGFEHVVYGFEPEPGYLAFSFYFYYLGVIYQKFAPGMFKSVIFGYARKKG